MTDKEETLSVMIRVLVIIGMIMIILRVIIITTTIISTAKRDKDSINPYQLDTCSKVFRFFDAQPLFLTWESKF